MSLTMTDDSRNRKFPTPFTDLPVGTLDYDGHEIAGMEYCHDDCGTT